MIRGDHRQWLLPLSVLLCLSWIIANISLATPIDLLLGYLPRRSFMVAFIGLLSLFYAQNYSRQKMRTIVGFAALCNAALVAYFQTIQQESISYLWVVASSINVLICHWIIGSSLKYSYQRNRPLFTLYGLITAVSVDLLVYHWIAESSLVTLSTLFCGLVLSILYYAVTMPIISRIKYQQLKNTTTFACKTDLSIKHSNPSDLLTERHS